jgi:hypothetical protein
LKKKKKKKKKQGVALAKPYLTFTQTRINENARHHVKDDVTHIFVLTSNKNNHKTATERSEKLDVIAEVST